MLDVNQNIPLNDLSQSGPVKPIGPKKDPDAKKKIGIMGRLFGRVNGNKPDKPEEPKKPSGDWSTLDLSKGIYKDPNLYQKSHASVQHHLRDTLSGVSRNFGVKNELAKRLTSKRSRGLTRSEVRNTIKDMQKEGKLTKSQARRYISKFKAYK
jgi:hypothetical protein